MKKEYDERSVSDIMKELGATGRLHVKYLDDIIEIFWHSKHYRMNIKDVVIAFGCHGSGDDVVEKVLSHYEVKDESSTS